jgi:hypothetical protein
MCEVWANCNMITPSDDAVLTVGVAAAVAVVDDSRIALMLYTTSLAESYVMHTYVSHKERARVQMCTANE